jgi:hypothetical protein
MQMCVCVYVYLLLANNLRHLDAHFARAQACSFATFTFFSQAFTRSHIPTLFITVIKVTPPVGYKT